MNSKWTGEVNATSPVCEMYIRKRTIVSWIVNSDEDHLGNILILIY